MMRSRSTVYGTLTLAVLALLVYAAPTVAHHAFGAEFDADAPLQIRGEIVRVEWVNPHSWIHLRVVEITTIEGTRNGEVDEVWMVEGGTLNVLLRRGLRRECLAIGTELIVDGYQAKNHSLQRANGRDVTFPDGRKFFMGSSGTGAPEDGAEGRGGASGDNRC